MFQINNKNRNWEKFAQCLDCTCQQGTHYRQTPLCLNCKCQQGMDRMLIAPDFWRTTLLDMPDKLLMSALLYWG